MQNITYDLHIHEHLRHQAQRHVTSSQSKCQSPPSYMTNITQLANTS